MNFYHSDIAYKLTDPLSFTTDINTYLKQERELLLSLVGSFHTIIEAGCTRGHYTQLITSIEKDYIGIDIAARQIADAKHIYKDNKRAAFLCDDIQNIGEVFIKNRIPIEGSMLFFPFNCFGNLKEAAGVLAQVVALQIPFVIFTYANNSKSSIARSKYYQASGFDNLVPISEKGGTLFTHQSGLHTIAYNESWFKEIFYLMQIKYRCIPFGDIGKAYCNF